MTSIALKVSTFISPILQITRLRCSYLPKALQLVCWSQNLKSGPLGDFIACALNHSVHWGVLFIEQASGHLYQNHLGWFIGMIKIYRSHLEPIKSRISQTLLFATWELGLDVWVLESNGILAPLVVSASLWNWQCGQFLSFFLWAAGGVHSTLRMDKMMLTFMPEEAFWVSVFDSHFPFTLHLLLPSNQFCTLSSK